MTPKNELLELIEENLLPIDKLNNEINTIIPIESKRSDIDSFRSELAGLLSVAICATYENCIKEILIYHASLYSKFESFIKDTYEKLNSKILFDDLIKYASMFDKQLPNDFKKIIEDKYHGIGTERKESDLSAGRIVNEQWKYKTLLETRHKFAHTYQKTETLEAVYRYHTNAKNVILAFAEALSKK